jgi:succinoglycan biosynthesis transport protein ExoP
MTPVDLRHSLDDLRRHVLFIFEAVIVVAVVAGVLSNLRTPAFRATATVLLRPNDPAEQLNPANAQRLASDPDRYVEAQRSIVRSAGVAQEAAKRLRGVTVASLEKAVEVEQGGRSDILRISGRATGPVRAREIANAVAEGYIENRRKSAVAGLQEAADDIQTKLRSLQDTIAQLDTQIGDGSPIATASATPHPPYQPPSGPAAPAGPVTLGTDPGGQPTTKEALKAARYAAAVQYETLFARQQELLVDITLKRGEAELIAAAKTPSRPISPQPIQDTLLGAVVGLLLSVGIVLLREQLQDRIHSSEEVERITGLPTLSQLPFDDESASNPTEVAALYRPLSPLSEAVRAMRTSIQYLSLDRPMKVLLVTSAVPGEGKSLVAANLAAVCAQAGYRTTLVSADLRRPGAARFFGVSPSAAGLTNLVVTRVGDDRAAVTTNGSLHPGSSVPTATSRTQSTPTAFIETPHPLLTYLPSGPAPPNPSELLGSKRMLEVLEGLSASADVVVIDTPPLLPVTDAAVLAAKADGVVLVAAMSETRREALKRASAVIRGTRTTVLGTVINKTPKASRSYYRYSYAADPPLEANASMRRLKRRREKSSGRDETGSSRGHRRRSKKLERAGHAER